MNTYILIPLSGFVLKFLLAFVIGEVGSSFVCFAVWKNERLQTYSLSTCRLLYIFLRSILLVRRYFQNAFDPT